MKPSSISGINRLHPEEKRVIYSRLIPEELLKRFQLKPSLVDNKGNDLLLLDCDPDSPMVEMNLRHISGYPDPILYGHISDTLNGQVHVLLYMLQDPSSPRFDVDRLQDGTPTQFGTRYRNISAEIAALKFGLAPGQIRRGLRLLGPAILAFERFVTYLGHTLYFAEPLYYHNAIIFERYGFNYAKGRQFMERIHEGFKPNGGLIQQLDGSSPFRNIEAAHSIRLRSWAIHDGVLGEKYSNVTMYKQIGKKTRINTTLDCPW